MVEANERYSTVLDRLEDVQNALVFHGLRPVTQSAQRFDFRTRPEDYSTFEDPAQADASLGVRIMFSPKQLAVLHRMRVDADNTRYRVEIATLWNFDPRLWFAAAPMREFVATVALPTVLPYLVEAVNTLAARMLKDIAIPSLVTGNDIPSGPSTEKMAATLDKGREALLSNLDLGDVHADEKTRQ